ncbi:DUF6404 family protein [Escherichia coli]|nr:DUF6404 family protein [Escherichia coli]MEC9607841.1 DUF6404 family protein [Escherichia coli]MEC9653199.1 DUF6404 family protein [Escherichia coli]MEC9789621.1 DUF6404 family protein [Escherichia coli]MED0004042.1 DUF6404 family protein [Escherichia coli]MED0196210.1 DUF6404 family protein [Escherichia coli]
MQERFCTTLLDDGTATGENCRTVFLFGLFMASFHWWRRKVNRLPPWDDV